MCTMASVVEFDQYPKLTLNRHSINMYLFLMSPISTIVLGIVIKLFGRTCFSGPVSLQFWFLLQPKVEMNWNMKKYLPTAASCQSYFQVTICYMSQCLKNVGWSCYSAIVPVNVDHSVYMANIIISTWICFSNVLVYGRNVWKRYRGWQI